MFANGAGALQSIRVRSKPIVRALGLHMGGGLHPPRLFSAAQAASLLQSIRVPSKPMLRALRFQLARSPPPPLSALSPSPPRPRFSIFKPGKLASKRMSQTHAASIAFANWGGGGPRTPPPPTTPLVFV